MKNGPEAGDPIIIEFFADSDDDANAKFQTLSEAEFLFIDENFPPIRINRPASRRKSEGLKQTFVVRGRATRDNREKLTSMEFVYKLWSDEPNIAHKKCNNGRRGDIDRVALCIGAEKLWGLELTGKGITVGIVDGGINREDFPSVIDGSRSDWGTLPDATNTHGEMCATDALGMAPDISLLDLNVFNSVDGFANGLSEAIFAFSWARDRFVEPGPHQGAPLVLSNSWSNSADDYVSDPNHPFTLLVGEVIEIGIKVLFSAGNCGQTCPNSVGCSAGEGPGQSIYGANGLNEVMSIGAAKLNLKRAKYSSQGPSMLGADKPDFCGYAQFKGYYSKDSGTSAACPIVAGCVALLLQSDTSLTQLQLRQILAATSRDIEATGFDFNTGAGVVRVDNAYYALNPTVVPDIGWRERLCDRTEQRWRRCAEWRQTQITTCAQWADQGSNQCAEWADEGTDECAAWRDDGADQCQSWIALFRWFCVGWYWVASWVCIAWYWVANLVCQAWFWVANVVCVLYVTIVSWVCLVWAWILLRVTFTNCKCQL